MKNRDNIEIQRMLRESKMMQTVELPSSKSIIREEILRETEKYRKTKTITQLPAEIAPAVVSQTHTQLSLWSDLDDGET